MTLRAWCALNGVTEDKTLLMSIGTDGLSRSSNLLAVCLLEPDTGILNKFFISGADASAVQDITGISPAQYDDERKALDDVIPLVRKLKETRPYIVTYAYRFASPYLGNAFPGLFPAQSCLDLQRLASRLALPGTDLSPFKSWSQMCFWTQTKMTDEAAPLKLDEIFRLASGVPEQELFGEMPKLFVRPRQLNVIWTWLLSA